MAKINLVIPKQAFENILTRIGEILVDEIDNQVVLSYDTDLELKVFLERFVPFDHTELPCINLSLGRGDYSNKNARSEDGLYRYFIDVYTKAKTSDVGEGDTLATLKLHKIMGIVRYILENPIYKTLGFATPSISNIQMEGMTFQDPTEKDGTHSVMGRLIYAVRAPETINLLVPNLIAGFETSVKIDESDAGYVFTKFP